MSFDRWVRRQVAVAAAAALVAGPVVGSSLTWAVTRRGPAPTSRLALASPTATATPSPVGQGIYTVLSVDGSGAVMVSPPDTPGITVAAGVQQSSLVRSYDAVTYLGVSGTAFSLARPFLGVPRSLGPARRVFPAEDAGLIGLQIGPVGSPSTIQLVLARPGGALARGPFTLPAGWDVVAEVSDGYVVVQDPTPGPLRLWTPDGGFTRTYASSVRDVLGVEGDVLAWRSPGGCDTATTECPLHVSSVSTGADSTVQPPDGHGGFLQGGAISPDTNEVAAFVATSQTGRSPAAQLAVATLSAQYVAPDYREAWTSRVVADSTVQVGEPLGFAAWSPDSQRVFFCGLGPFLRVYSPSAPGAETLNLPASTAFAVF